jgi:hypothetical protein
MMFHTQALSTLGTYRRALGTLLLLVPQALAGGKLWVPRLEQSASRIE